MTNFAVQSTLGAVSPLVSKDKGSFGNRMNCAGEHMKNNLVSNVQTAGVALVGGGAVYGLKKTNAAANFIGKGIDKAITFVAKKTNTINSSVIQKALNASPKAKALSAVLALGTIALGYITHKHAYKAGQIDQKYTDRAKMEKNMV